jgi:hypothetical protein
MDLLMTQLGAAPSSTSNVSWDDIYGHTPDTPTTTPKKPTTWETINNFLDIGQKAASVYTTVKTTPGGAPLPPPPPDSGMSTGTKLLIGGTVLAVVGVVAWKVFGKKKKSH